MRLMILLVLGGLFLSGCCASKKERKNDRWAETHRRPGLGRHTHDHRYGRGYSKPKKKVVLVTFDQPEVKGFCHPKKTLLNLKRRSSQIRHCYEKAFYKQDKQYGMLDFSWEIHPHGHVLKAQHTGGSIHQTRLSNCVNRVIHRIKFVNESMRGVCLVKQRVHFRKPRHSELSKTSIPFMGSRKSDMFGSPLKKDETQSKPKGAE